MSSELHIPVITGTPGTEFYRHSETFRRRSEASKAKMLKYWSDGRHRRRVDTKQAKPVAAYRMDGTFVGWWKSARKAAIALFPDGDYHMDERNVRACRQGVNGKNAKKSHKGFMFRDWTGDTSDIAPYAKAKPRRKSGYHKDNSKNCKPCVVDYGDGDPIRFDSVKALAAALGVRPQTISAAIHAGGRYKGKTIKFL